MCMASKNKGYQNALVSAVDKANPGNSHFPDAKRENTPSIAPVTMDRAVARGPSKRNLQQGLGTYTNRRS